ncbi:MAG: hypothetical protein ACRDKS_03780 [Actinomycetota bacterium]
MEDRQPSGLLLEMLAGPDPAGVERWQREVAIPKALATGVVSRGTAFRNLRPDESRFQQKVDAFSHLTVYEIGPGDITLVRPNALPAGEDGVTVVDRLAFRRYPRPSQGRCSGKRTLGIFLILISPTERSRAQELRDWADFTHIHGIAASSPQGFTTITPYVNAGGKDPLYLHFYELDTEDPVAAVDDMPNAVMKRWGYEMGDEAFMRWAMSDALDIWYVNVFGRVE